MSNQMPIYSHVVPKSQYRKAAKNAASKDARPTNLGRGDFDPLNYNSGGQFHLLNAPLDTNPNLTKNEKQPDKKESRRSKDDPRPRRGQTKATDPNEGKVEAYLRQNQVSIRQQQHRHSAVRQAEHRVNLRSLPLNDVMTSRHDRTPTERHRGFPERERDGNREHRRERDKDRDKDEFDGTPLSPQTRADREVRVRKSSSAHKVAEPTLSTDKRRFFCREWAFQKIAHCLEQRPVSKTCGALILGDAGSGKTALCQELSDPGQGPQARQQRALNRRLLARHFLQSQTESSLRPGEFIRSLAMQILSQSSRHARGTKSASPTKQTSPSVERRNSEDERLIRRFKHMGVDDGEESSKPLLGDSEDQRTDDDEEAAREREANLDAMIDDAALSQATELPQLPAILPRAPPTNPFLGAAPPGRAGRPGRPGRGGDAEIYENHENVFLRNLSQRQSKELRSSRLLRQSSEPLTDKTSASVRKSHSTEQRADSASEGERPKSETSPPGAKLSRIPVASFRYPNKSDLRSSSTENSPHKTKPTDVDTKKETESAERTGENETEDTPEYQNVLKPTKVDLNDSEDKDEEMPDLEVLLEKKRRQLEDVPPPIPSLPVSPRTLIANAYYEKLLSDTEIQQALLPQNLEKNPDECFKRALLFPLLEIDPPKQCLFLLVDAIDEGSLTGQAIEKPDSTEPSRTVAVLLARHQHLFPQWLLLVCTARRHCKQLTKMFTGFRKITLDELHRAHVSADVQRYVLARLDTEPRLRARVSSDTTAAAAAAAALDHLRIKSDGCLLYLEKVLDGVADGFIALREIREIPGTLNGLYLWLAQRLFHGRRFTKVRLLLDVVLAARCGVTEEMLYRCLLTKEYSVTRDDFNRRLHLLRRILVMERSSGYLSLFHHSFARWLLDVKHCTRRYLCSAREGHAALAMYYTLHAQRLTALEIHNYVLHMTSLEQYWTAQKKSKSGDLPDNSPLDVHSLVLLWVLDSGCDVESALSRETDALSMLRQSEQATENKSEEKEADPESEGKESSSAIDAIMPSLSGGCDAWPRDSRVLRALLELTRGDCAAPDDGTVTDLLESPQPESASAVASATESVEPPPLPGAAHDLATCDAADTLDRLLERHPDLVSTLDATGGTPLHCAARNGKAKAAAVLLSHGARPDLPDKDHWSPLRAAAWAGHTEVVEVLLEYGCEVDCVDADNRTALRAAAWSGHEAVVSRLLAAGASADKPDAEGRTPLIAAAYMGHAEIVRALLDAGAEIDHADEDGRTALAVAALCASGAACASILLERGADVHKPDRDKATPLLVAAFEGHTEICELLLEAEADIEAADVAGRTALWAAASAGHAPTVRLLLFWGACVDNMDNEGRTVLSTAAAQGNVEVVRQLLDRGLDEHHRDNSGWTPLHYAAFEGHVEVCEALLEAGAKVDEADNDGKGPLMLASQEGHSRLVEILIDDWGAPVDQHAHDGKTALRLAALEGHFDCVSALHSRGADVDAVDADRRSALYVLALDNRMAMARYLISECGASVDIRDAEGRTPLHVSAWQGHHDMVNLLIKVGIAAQEGHEECVLWLLQHGADPLQADHCGRTPAKVAWRAGHANICRLLERAAGPSAPAPAPADEQLHIEKLRASPEYKRRSVHSSNSTKSSGNLTGSCHSHDKETRPVGGTQDKVTRANLPLSFAQQVARVGRGRREKERDSTIPENHAVEKDAKLRSYAANERDADIRGYASELRPRGYTGYAYERDNMSPLYASPPRSPISDICSPTQPAQSFGSQPPSLAAAPPSLAAAPPSTTDQHFNRDTHMRIILGRDTKQPPETRESRWAARGRVAYGRLVGSLGRARGRILKHKNKRNGIVTNPAMRLVANVRNGLDSAAANIRRTGVALAASASSNNPAVKTNAFQWRKETPL